MWQRITGKCKTLAVVENRPGASGNIGRRGEGALRGKNTRVYF